MVAAKNCDAHSRSCGGVSDTTAECPFVFVLLLGKSGQYACKCSQFIAELSCIAKNSVVIKIRGL